MSDMRRGAGMGFGLILGIIAAVVVIPSILGLLACGGCAMLAGTATIVDDGDVATATLPDGQGEEDPPKSPSDVAPATSARTEASSSSVESEERLGDALDRSIKISLHEYRQLRNGMTYEAVREIVGIDGEVVSQAGADGYQIAIIAWSNGDFSNANATFENGKLTGKAQVGLPAGPTYYGVAAEKARAKVDEERAARISAEADRQAAEMDRRGELAVQETMARIKGGQEAMNEFRTSIGPLESVEDIDAAVERLLSISETYLDTEAAVAAKNESAALASLRLAIYAESTSGRDPVPAMRKIVERFPGTIAADRASKRLDDATP